VPNWNQSTLQNLGECLLVLENPYLAPRIYLGITLANLMFDHSFPLWILQFLWWNVFTRVKADPLTLVTIQVLEQIDCSLPMPFLQSGRKAAQQSNSKALYQVVHK